MDSEEKNPRKREDTATEWNTMNAELITISRYFDELDMLNYRVLRGENQALEPFLSGLLILRNRLVCVSERKHLLKEIDKNTKKAEKMMNIWLTTPKNKINHKMFQRKIARHLIDAYTNLLLYKQEIGIGIQLKYRKSRRSKMKEQAGV